jgi:hypothetical protein
MNAQAGDRGRRSPANGVLGAAAVLFVGYLVLLVLAPARPPAPDALNVAAAQGYDINAAFWAAVLWTLFGAAGLAWLSLAGRLAAPAPETARAPDVATHWKFGEVAIVFALVVLAHWPAFLARYGDYAEDRYLLSTLARMACGETPYSDFEFIYGPLIIAPAHAWMQVFGYSMAAYYALYALALGALHAVVLLVLQRYLPDRRARYVAFAIIAALLLDTLLGLNWIGWRRFLPLFALLVVAARPLDLRAALGAGGLLALAGAYSFEYAAAGLAACGAIYAVLLFKGDLKRVIVCGVVVAATAIAGTLAIAALLTGGALGDYLISTAEIVAAAGADGLGAFKFYWTLHSAAAFALLSLCVAVAGAGARRALAVELAEGDRLLIGGIALALVSFKIAFQRADIWHMGPPFLALAFLVLTRPPVAAFTFDTRIRQAATALVVVMALANLVGMAPTASQHAVGWLNGARDVFSGRPASGPIAARTTSTDRERTQADADIVALAAWLAAPAQRERPVIFYGDLWWLNHRAGVCPIGYLNYDLIYANARRPIAAEAAAHRNVLVVLSEEQYAVLFEGAIPEPDEPDLTAAKRLALVTSTVHHTQTPYEQVLKTELWRRNLGAGLVEDFGEAARFGPYVVIARGGAH